MFSLPDPVLTAQAISLEIAGHRILSDCHLKLYPSEVLGCWKIKSSEYTCWTTAI